MSIDRWLKELPGQTQQALDLPVEKAEIEEIAKNNRFSLGGLIGPRIYLFCR